MSVGISGNNGERALALSAMPFQAPGSLTADEIYAVLAYILAEGNSIDKAAVLDAETLPRVQMPNRDGFIPDPRPEWFK